MDKDQVLRSIQANIANGNHQLASTQIIELANCFSDEPFTLLTCASLLKTIGDEKGTAEIVRRISLNTSNGPKGIEIAKGLRSIGYPKESIEVLSKMDDSDDVIRERMLAFFDLRDHLDVKRMYGMISTPTISDSILMAESLSASKEHEGAENIVNDLLKEAPNDILVKRCYCNILVSSGRNKEGERFIKENLKNNKTSPDANALAAYYLWIQGKSTSAGAYASKAVKEDSGHIMAMEILAYCLVDKGKVQEAKIVAGAINEKDPGNPAVVRILDMCSTLG